jgi:hypothetical protein
MATLANTSGDSLTRKHQGGNDTAQTLLRKSACNAKEVQLKIVPLEIAWLKSSAVEKKRN